VTEEEALRQSTGFVNCSSRDGGWLIGYLPFDAANTLMGTGKYAWWQASVWGYVLQCKEIEGPGWQHRERA